MRRWLTGDLPMLDEHWQQIVDLCARQDRAADEALAEIDRLEREIGRSPDTITLCMARTQDDADRLGWPCPGAHVAVIRRIVERAPEGLRIVPVHPGEDEAADADAARRTAH